MVKFKKSGKEAGKTAFHVYSSDLDFVAEISYFDKARSVEAGYKSYQNHWALLRKSGRIDWFFTLAEAKDEAKKSYI
jgi:hypothetical protein